MNFRKIFIPANFGTNCPKVKKMGERERSPKTSQLYNLGQLRD